MGYRGDPSREEYPRCSSPELYLSWPLIFLCLFELRCRYSHRTRLTRASSMISSPRLLQCDWRRHREFLTRHWNLDQCRTVVFECFANHRLDLVRSFGSKS